jgi:hypothetical protein
VEVTLKSEQSTSPVTYRRPAHALTPLRPYTFSRDMIGPRVKDSSLPNCPSLPKPACGLLTHLNH